MILLDTKRIGRTLKRMAYQIVEEAHGAPVQLLGLNERGFAIAQVMYPIIKKHSAIHSPLKQMYAESDEPFRFDREIKDGPVLVIVDDVIFSGGTLQAAMDKIMERSVFQKIFVAVLVDRGHRKYPIQAEVVGAHVPTKLNEQVNLVLIDGKPDKVVLEKI